MNHLYCGFCFTNSFQIISILISFLFENSSPLKEDSKLKITCWDEDLLIDGTELFSFFYCYFSFLSVYLDFEGQVLVDLSEFKELGVNQERTFTLQGRGKKKEEISGCLVLNFLICEGSVSAMSTKKKQNIPVFKYESDLSLPPAIAEYQVFGKFNEINIFCEN